jgi:uncharacterized membrane protein YccC
VPIGLPFACPTCKERLRTSILYAIAVNIATAIASLAVPLHFGLGWLYVCLVAVCLYGPFFLMLAILARITYPPRLQLSMTANPALFQK